MTDKHDVDGNSSTNNGEGRSDSERGQALNRRDDITDPGGRWQTTVFELSWMALAVTRSLVGTIEIIARAIFCRCSILESL